MSEIPPEEITVSRPVEQPQRSLAMMLKAQYISKELNDIFSATELREHEVITISTLFMTRFITMVMSTTEEDLQGLQGEELKQMKERLAIKSRIVADVNAMAYAMQDSFMYAFGLCRQSLKRQSRHEARDIAMSPRPVSVASEVGIKDKLFTKLGISRKYKEGYIVKEE